MYLFIINNYNKYNNNKKYYYYSLKYFLFYSEI